MQAPLATAPNWKRPRGPWAADTWPASHSLKHFRGSGPALGATTLAPGRGFIEAKSMPLPGLATVYRGPGELTLRVGVWLSPYSRKCRQSTGSR